MQTRYLSLVAACLVPFAGVAVAQDKSVPEGFTKEEASQYLSIQESVASVFGSEKVAALKTTEQRIKSTFDQMVKTYGVGMRLVIAKAMADIVPDEFHGYVAKRALSYSPLRAKELLASLSKDGANASVNSALGVLPTQSVHTAESASAAGVSLASAGRVFELPQVDARRRVVSTNASGRLIQAVGDVDLNDGNGPVPVTATLGDIQDNGFTLDGMGYQLVSGNTLIGTYMAVQADTPTAGEYTFYFKNTNAGANNGSGPARSVVLTNVVP